MKNNLKKIVSNLVLLSFTSSSIIACSNDSNTSSGPSTPSLTASGKSASSNDSFDGLWANVVNYDSLDQDSNLDLVPNNDSSANVTFLGCDNDKAYALNAESVMDFSAGYQFPTTSNYADKWVSSFPLQPDGKKSPIYSSAAIFNHAIHFSGAGQSGHANCYFKLDNPSLKAPLFVKLANNWKSQCSDNQTCGTTVRDYIPKLLQEKQSKNSWWYSQQLINDTPVPLGLWAGYENLSSLTKIPAGDGSIGGYMDILYDEAFLEPYMEKLDFAMENLIYTDYANEGFWGGGIEDWLDAVDYRTLRSAEQFYDVFDSGSDLSILKIDGWEGMTYAQRMDKVRTFMRNFENVGATTNEKGQVEFTLSPRGGTAMELNDVKFIKASEADKYVEGLKITQRPLITPSADIAEIEATTGTKMRSMAQVFKTEGVPVAEQTDLARTIAASSELDGEVSSGFRAIEKKAMQVDEVSTSGLMGTLGITFAVMAGLDFLFSSFGKWIGGEPSIGIYDTTINKISFAAVTASDAASWNKSHPNNQINANTSFTTIGVPDAVNQVMLLSSNDSNVDGQYAITMSLQALSTPFERYEEYSPAKDSCMQDPFLGTIGKSDCSGKTHKSDGVMVWHISDNVGSQVQDFNFNKSQEIGDNHGVKQLSAVSPLSAPSYQTTSIVGADKQNLPLSTMLAKAKQLLLPKKGVNSKVLNDNLEGLVFNHNQTVTMRVTLPAAPSSAKNDSGANLVGGGLWTKMVAVQDDIQLGANDSNSGQPMLLFTNAMSTYADSQYATESGHNYVFSHRFNCKFPIKPGSSCDLTMKLTGHNDGKKHIANLLLADKTSYTTYIPVYINYNLISKTNQIEIDAGDAYPHGVSFKNVSGKTYQQLGMNGLPKGAAVSYQPSGCNTNLASGSECLINFNLKNVNVDGDTEDFLMNIYGIDAGNVGKPFESIPDMDRLPLKITINNSDWAAAKTKKAASAGR